MARDKRWLDRVRAKFLAQHGKRRERHRHQRGLRVLRQRQLRLGAFPHDARQLLAKRLVHGLEHGLRGGKALRQPLPHAYGLAALARKCECKCHAARVLLTSVFWRGGSFAGHAPWRQRHVSRRPVKGGFGRLDAPFWPASLLQIGGRAKEES